MRLVRGIPFGLSVLAMAGAARAATFADCPLSGVMPNSNAEAKSAWQNWDTRAFSFSLGGNTKDVAPEGIVCTQTYDESGGKTDGSALEISENHNESWTQQGAEILRNDKGYVVGHLSKDGKGYSLNVNATLDDGCMIRVVQVQPFKRSLTAPSGNDCRMLGHMPGFVSSAPTKKYLTSIVFRPQTAV